MKRNNDKKQTIVVGLSGGVDSSVSTKILLDQGYEVIGLFMKNWEEGGPQCTATEDGLTAEKVCEKLKIPFHTVNLSKEYWDNVFQYFLEQNKLGRTPNPDILCNKYVKFDAFFREVKKLGSGLMATGHYARKVWNKETEKYELHIPKDTEKDQTYFLHAISQDQLARTVFPLEDLGKNEVRDIAKKENFLNADKKDSTGICFIGERNYFEFLQKYIPKNPGNIVESESQKIISEHIGLPFYTIGQRKDLGIGGVKGFDESPWFVIEKNFEKNELIVSQDEGKLLGDSLEAEKLTWISGEAPAEEFECEARIRYRSTPVPCTVSYHSEKAEVTFKSPVRAISPGQSVVFYQGSNCLGGGEII